jgi:hypothetical protein
VFVTWPDRARREAVSRRECRAHFARIAGLHPAIGEALDARRAPLRCYRFVAYAPTRDLPLAASQQSRYEALVTFADTYGRWPLYGEEMRTLAYQAHVRWTGAGLRPRRPYENSLFPRAAVPKAARTASPPRARAAGGAAAPPSSPSSPSPPASTPTSSMPAARPAPETGSSTGTESLALSLAKAVQQQDPLLAETLQKIAGIRRGRAAE